MTEPQHTRRWWTCCYECPPCVAFPDAPGTMIKFERDEQGLAAALAVDWMSQHAEETGHMRMVMVSRHPLLPGDSMPQPVCGDVLFGDTTPEQRVFPQVRGLRISKLDADGKPTGEVLQLGQALSVSFVSAYSTTQKALPHNDNQGRDRPQ